MKTNKTPIKQSNKTAHTCQVATGDRLLRAYDLVAKKVMMGGDELTSSSHLAGMVIPKGEKSG